VFACLLAYLNITRVKGCQTSSVNNSPNNMTTPFQFDQHLTHYWPICNGTMQDVIGLADMTQGNSTLFTTDRFGNENSALALNGGWTQVPPGIYFNTPELTISVWVYPSNLGIGSRIIEFANGESNDNILFSLYKRNTLNPYFEIFDGTFYPPIISLTSSVILTQNQWQFFAVTFDATNTKMYLNGQQVVNLSQTYNLRTLKRYNCYIGKSAWAGDGYSNSYLDDLAFFNKSLTQDEIIQLMNQNETSKHSKAFVKTLIK
jgi:hypothetical protein